MPAATGHEREQLCRQNSGDNGGRHANGARRTLLDADVVAQRAERQPAGGDPERDPGDDGDGGDARHATGRTCARRSA